ncbi:hypothetical protein AMS68_003245 [Peltaster fructicola]|uniref:Major facilitator superfamily (MFS) profile domain-containing protein n=1 Tax=Peltaster fructicola TaxID=286661 RepID=A0A6H0XSY1_9PEZI|nr:hypothetical protein AMS68_003245 [Peltaster fructicola]
MTGTEKQIATDNAATYTASQLIESGLQSQHKNGSSDEKATVSQDSNDLTQFPRGAKLVVILTALGLVNLLVSIDQSIVSTAIPKITDEFHDIAAIGWYGSAYLLSIACCQMLYGRLYTLLPVKTVFVVAIILFEVGSIICGAAPGSTALIVGRAIAGLGGSGIWSGILVIIAHCVPLRLRPGWAALDSITFGLGSVLGPLIGGAFADGVTWRWCFYINAPLGGVATLVVALFMPKIGSDKEQTSREAAPLGWRTELLRFDPVGIISIIIAMVFLLLALQYGGAQYAWSSGRIIAFLVVFAVFTIIFILTQTFGDKVHRAIPKAVALQRTVLAGSFYFFCMGGAFTLLIYYLPVWFQAVQDVSAFISGVKTIPLMLAYIISSIVSGIMITRVGYYTPFIIASSVLMAIGAGMITTLNPSSTAGAWIGYQVLFGFGLGLGCDVPFVAVQTVLPLDMVPSATAVLMFFQTLGAATFISVAQSVFTNSAVGPLGKLAPDIDALNLLNSGFTDIRTTLDPAMSSQVESVLNTAVDRTFLVGAIMAALTFLGAVAIEHKSVRQDEEVEQNKSASASGGGTTTT